MTQRPFLRVSFLTEGVGNRDEAKKRGGLGREGKGQKKLSNADLLASRYIKKGKGLTSA